MKYLAILLLFTQITVAQSDVSLSLRAQFNGSYGYTVIGNTLNPFDNLQNPLFICNLLTQSSATLNLLPSQNIAAAFLYWGGIGDGAVNPNIKLNNTSYTATQTFIGYPETSTSLASYFVSYVNVTAQVQAQGNGIYTFSELELNSILPLYCSISVQNAGWHLIVIYNETTLPNNQVNIYDGINILSFFFNNGITPLTINNLNVIDSQNSKLTYVASNGSSVLFLNESISINGNILSNALNPANNPFNSTNSFTGSTTNWNQDIDTFDISSFINVGDTQANIVFKSLYYRFVQTLVTSIRSELPDATVQLNTVSGQNVCNNRTLQINYTVQNTNSNGNLPANMPVSFYADNVLLSTVLTPSPIAIGGVLPLQTSVIIPVSVSNTFNLRVVVDNAVSASSTIAESNEGNNESTQSITLLPPTLLATFNLQNLFCTGAIVPALPNVSSNGVSGSWSPAVISNINSGSYVFTPAAAGTPGSGALLCSAQFTLDVVVALIVTPTFSLQNTFCAGTNVPVLPLISNNGITGSWSPSVVSNQNNGSYVFTPTAGQPAPAGTCAASSTLNVTINPNVNAVFALPNSFCAGAAVPVLPTTSNNGIIGVWSPSVINNQTSGLYTFTPNVGGCGLPFSQTITVTPNATPTFSLPDRFCQGAILPVLPTVSNNGISGSWSANVIDNQINGNYVFTPSAGQCALPFNLNTVVQIPIPTTASLTICNDNQGNTVVPKDLISGLDPNDYTFVWTRDNVILPQNTTTISVVTAGNYQLVATATALGCVQTFSFSVSDLPPISANVLVSDDFDLNATITVLATGGSGQYQYSFNNFPYQNNAVFTVSDGGDIVIKVIDNADCTQFEKTVTVWQYARFFSPNNDSYNDTWGITSRKKIRIDIFDRFGKLLKQLQSSERWNGTFNGAQLPADDYWFSVQYDDNKTFRGHFSLKR